MKYFFLQLYFFISSSLGFGQGASIQQIGRLDKVIDECSGMVLLEENRLLHINDSGNKPELYVTDTLGNLLLTTCIIGAENTDWEELTLDGKGNLYIGDFGNNRNKRKDLKIYQVDINNLLTGDSTANLKGEINFAYEDQNRFPPSRYQRNYDMEAMIFLNDSLYLFSKNRTKPFTGYTYCYQLPAKPGQFTASKIDSFKTGIGLQEFFWISAAAFDPVKNQLALMGYDKLWLFYDFEGRNFFKGKNKLYYLGHMTQKEAISFVNSYKFYLTEEVNPRSDGNIYSFTLPKPVSLVEEYLPKRDTSSMVSLFDKEFQDTIKAQINCPANCNLKWEIFSTEGKRLLFGQADPFTQSILKINAASLDNGGYVINIIINNKPHAFKIKKPLITKKD